MPANLSALQRALRRFHDDESAAGSTFAIFMAIICIVVGGLAIDSSNAWQMRQRLQTTADVAAHAGALILAYPDETGVKTVLTEASAIAAINMPTAQYGTVLSAADIQIGKWNSVTRTLDTASAFPNAVRATTRLEGGASQTVQTFLLKLIGFTQWRISTSAVAAIDVADCHTDGLIAGGVVDLTSNNSFYNGMCIHGQQGVQMNSNNFFDYDDGVRISMPNPDPVSEGGMYDELGNDNVNAARSLSMAFIEPLLTTTIAINALVADLSDPDYDDLPDYITQDEINEVWLVKTNDSSHDNDNHGTSFDISMLEDNRINVFHCTDTGSGSKISIPGNVTIRNMIIVADCPIEFGQNSAIESGVFITTSTDANSLKGANGVRLGLADDCTAGGGAQFVTMGGVNFASEMEYHGSQVIAHGDVHIAAGINGLSGISIQAAGGITVTANNIMGACSGGVDTVADQYVVHLVY